MARLELKENAYELGLSGLNELCVGEVQGSSASDLISACGETSRRCLANIESGSTGGIFITAEHRASFLGALLAVWGEHQEAILVPDPALLNSDLRERRIHAELPRALSPEARASSLMDLHLTWEEQRRIAHVLTSGSSGTPTQHAKTAKQLLGETLSLVELLKLGPKHTVMATTASHHVYGLLFGVLAPFLSGARVVVDDDNEPSAFHPHRLAALAQKTNTTHLITVPAHLRSIVEAAPDLTGITRVISSAAPLAPSDARRFEDKFGIEVTDVLGSTETGGIATRRPAQSLAWTPLPGVQISVDTADVLSIDSPWADGPSGSTPTGERAHILPSGQFEYLGRADGVIKVGGKRISLKAIEDAARLVPGVVDAVAHAQTVTSLRGVEIWLAAAAEGLTRGALKAALRDHLDPVFLPRKIRIFPQLPRDERGKVQRTSLLPLFQAASDEPTP